MRQTPLPDSLQKTPQTRSKWGTKISGGWAREHTISQALISVLQDITLDGVFKSTPNVSFSTPPVFLGLKSRFQNFGVRARHEVGTHREKHIDVWSEALSDDVALKP